MQKVIVSIVSAQTIPNYLFIKEFQGIADIFLFISTVEMEAQNKTKTIYETAGIEKKRVRKILIHEDELYLAKEKLDKLGWDKQEHSFLVNITGGTKLMSNAVYEYFKGDNTRFFYLPIGKNFIKEIFDNKPAETSSITYKISVDEYLNLYGIHPKEEGLKLNETSVISILNHYKTKTPEKWIFTFLTSEKNLNEQQKIALWFEHLLYYKIKRSLDLSEQDIKQGIKLFKKETENNHQDNLTDNEIDIVFIYNNNCYIIEAKVSVGKKRVNTTAITNYLYKLAAINKRFGINAKAALMTYSDFSELSIKAINNLTKRCNILNLPYPLEKKDINDDEIFNNKLLTFVK